MPRVRFRRGHDVRQELSRHLPCRHLRERQEVPLRLFEPLAPENRAGPHVDELHGQAHLSVGTGEGPSTTRSTRSSRPASMGSGWRAAILRTEPMGRTRRPRVRPSRRAIASAIPTPTTLSPPGARQSPGTAAPPGSATLQEPPRARAARTTGRSTARSPGWPQARPRRRQPGSGGGVRQPSPGGSRSSAREPSPAGLRDGGRCLPPARGPSRSDGSAPWRVPSTRSCPGPRAGRGPRRSAVGQPASGGSGSLPDTTSAPRPARCSGSRTAGPLSAARRAPRRASTRPSRASPSRRAPAPGSRRTESSHAPPPPSAPSCPTPVGLSSFAIPKSRSFGVPSDVTRMFGGLMSRCTTRFWCA